MAIHGHMKEIHPDTERKFRKKTLSMHKAKEILRHGEVHGEPITKKQKKFFGLIAGGGTPTRV